MQENMHLRLLPRWSSSLRWGFQMCASVEGSCDQVWLRIRESHANPPAVFKAPKSSRGQIPSRYSLLDWTALRDRTDGTMRRPPATDCKETDKDVIDRWEKGWNVLKRYGILTGFRNNLNWHLNGHNYKITLSLHFFDHIMSSADNKICLHEVLLYKAC